MAAPTPTALLGQFAGASLAAAFPQVGNVSSNLDILQIVAAGGDAVLLNVDSTGVVHNPSLNPTQSAGGLYGADNTRLGVFQTHLAAGASTAAFFDDAFTNLAELDIIQVINVGGNVSYWLDTEGVAHGS